MVIVFAICQGDLLECSCLIVDFILVLLLRQLDFDVQFILQRIPIHYLDMLISTGPPVSRVTPIHRGNSNMHVLLAEIFVGPYSDVFIFWIVAVIVVFSSREAVCSIGGPGFVFQEHVVLLAFRQVSCHSWSNFPGVTVIAEVGMVSEY